MASDEALRKLQRDLAQIVGSVEPILFRDFATKYRDAKIRRPALAASSAIWFTRQVRNHLIPAFGDLSLDQVNGEAFNDWVDVVRGGSWPMVRRPLTRFFNTRKALVEILGAAHAEGLISRLPVIENPDEPRKTGRWLSDKEIIPILWRARPFIRFFFYLLWQTGYRPGEAAKYEWDMFQWSADGSVSVSVPARIVKTRRGRVVPINASVAKVLKLRLSRLGDDRFVFPNTLSRHDKRSEHLERWNDDWESARRRAGVAECVTYDLRRSFVSRKIRDGVIMEYIADLIDSSAAVLNRDYLHIDQKELRKAAI